MMRINALGAQTFSNKTQFSSVDYTAISKGYTCILDGYENAGYDKHNSSASVWKNLITKTNAIDDLVTNCWGTKSYNVSKTYGAAMESYARPVIGTGIWTFEIIFEVDQEYVTYAENANPGCMVCYQNTGTSLGGSQCSFGFEPGSTSTNVMLVSIGLGGHYIFPSTYYDKGRIYSFVLQQNGTYGRVLVNNKVLYTRSNCIVGETPNLCGYIYKYDHIYSWRFNKTYLTDEQLTDNFYIDTERFGIVS